ncbi:sporulation histidine kinase inhibitor Sda [Sutcliffiella horikoshii]|uniref:Sporulation histidine kinase inhibitor Sda n=1 Tax=Sutcliffiella horikoshii TaxID=79883 RepID=A0ABM6KMZ8_9BACI|nr:sporulation histidine kinase inhibitor Sda [Sutcliffiella horikoshii]ART77789.1 sporulation histidine kinase inhibitor Sda [Sutcliffiella horikoshii]
MDLLNDESLIEVYEAAMLNDLNEEFLKLILDEMKRRKIDIPVTNL